MMALAKWFRSCILLFSCAFLACGESSKPGLIGESPADDFGPQQDVGALRQGLIEDPEYSRILELLSREFVENTDYEDVSVTLLVSAGEGRGWKLGQYQGDQLWYPASVAKLACLPGIFHRMDQVGADKFYATFNEDLTSIFTNSDNFAFGRVVDQVTYTENFDVDASPDSYPEWLRRRTYFNRALDHYGLLEGQRVLMKTYPTNSGDLPLLAEEKVFKEIGGNRLTTNDAALLLRDLAEGSILPSHTSEIQALLRSSRNSASSIVGHDLPPGLEYYGKVGYGVGRIGDVCYIPNPDGSKVVIACFGYYDDNTPGIDPLLTRQATMGVLTEAVLDRLSLYPVANKVMAKASDDQNVQRTGTWTLMPGNDLFPTFFKPANASRATIEFHMLVPETGKYQISYAYAPLRKGIPFASCKVMQQNTPILDKPVDLTGYGNHWYHIGQYFFQKGTLTVVFEDKLQVEDGLIGISAVKIVPVLED
ncbi:MAG: hypothetical protein PWP23_715 [Candidatus Sumerlaeota bacterium]|nr:hypothetical protein [Candidatus Sumerlaeota bacterium]